MDAVIEPILLGLPLPALFLIIAICIFILGKGADLLVEEAVALSLKWGLPMVLIGATIVSLGTTLPEAAVSVMAAIEGNPGIALGNAVGSIICDTGMILGLSTLIAPLPLKREIVNRQGWIQLGAGILLVVSCMPNWSYRYALENGGRLPQFMGFIFLGLLVAYIYYTIRRFSSGDTIHEETEEGRRPDRGTGVILFRLMLGAALVIASSDLLIPTVQETALRLSVPESIIGATLVAFGTSLPELVTALTAVRKGHGELAVGNVIGADILNVLFVAGAAAAVTPAGLTAPPHFFSFLFPAMLGILIVFRVGIFISGDQLKRPFGALLLGIYGFVTVFSYFNMH